MKMWKVNPRKMCNKHILGEHVEMHMFVGTLKKGISVKGYIEEGLVELENISKRHNELVEEMLNRNMNHQSDITDTSELFGGKVNIKENELVLRSRCNKCRELQDEYQRII